MAYAIISWCHKGGRGDASSVGVAAGAASRRVAPASSSGIERFVRKLKKSSKMLCMATRPPAFQCQYDPLSYARNFESGAGEEDEDEDEGYLCHTFSARFVMAAASLPREVSSGH